MSLFDRSTNSVSPLTKQQNTMQPSFKTRRFNHNYFDLALLTDIYSLCMAFKQKHYIVILFAIIFQYLK